MPEQTEVEGPQVDPEVDDITGKLEQCNIAKGQRKKEDNLEASLGKLAITQRENEDSPVPPEVIPRRSSPQEDDERGDGETEEEQAQEGEFQIGEGKMVKLEAPDLVHDNESKDDKNEREEGEELTAKGPSFGVATHYQYQDGQVVYGYNNQPQSFYESSSMKMPASFPNYSQYQPGICPTDSTVCPKRGMEIRESYQEPPKFVRPQKEGITQAEVIGNNFNNLNSDVKKTSNIFRKQMSGGTMYTADNMPGSPEQLVPDPTMGSLHQGEYLGEGPEMVRMNSLELPQSWEGMNIRPFDVDDLLAVENLVEDSSNQLPPSQVSPQMPNNGQTPVGNSFYQGQPPNTRPTITQPQTQQQFHHNQFLQTKQQTSLGQSDDLGYESSPGGTPIPSPSSTITSPAPSNSSPPGPNYSPPPSNYTSPPSNMSQSSQDSGIMGSPLTLNDEQSEEPHWYIDSHIPSLSDALDVVGKDLMHMMKSNHDCKRANTKVNGVNNVPTNKIIMANGGIPGQTNNRAIPNVPNMNEIMPEQMKNLQTSQRPTGVVVAQNVMGGPPNSLNYQSRAVINQNLNSSSDDKLLTTKLQNAPAHINGLNLNGYSGSGSVFVTGASPLPHQPVVNKDGKIAISRLPNNNGNRQEQRPMVIIMPPQPVTHPNAKPVTKYAPIAPKMPTPQPSNTCNPVMASGQGSRSPQDSGKAPGDKKRVTPSPSQLLNLARRIVADLKREDICHSDQDGDTNLHLAVSDVDVDQYMVQAVLERLGREGLGHMVDAQNKAGQTPLYLAVSTNHPEKVKCLLDHGADVKPLASRVQATGAVDQWAAIHCASVSGSGHLDTLNGLLTSPGIDVDILNSDGHTALQCALMAHGRPSGSAGTINCIPIVQALMRKGANPNLQVSTNGKTALMFALESANINLIEATFELVDRSQLQTYLKTQSLNNDTCRKMCDRMKPTLEPAAQHRLTNILKPNSKGRTSPPCALTH